MYSTVHDSVQIVHPFLQPTWRRLTVRRRRVYSPTAIERSWDKETIAAREKAGLVGLPPSPALIANANRLLVLFHERKLPVIGIQTRHKADGSTWSRWMEENDAPRLIEGARDAEWMYDRFVNLAAYAMLKRDWPEGRGRSQ